MTHPFKIGKYEIHGELGRGAVGTVYKGFDPQISRWVAIKAIVKASLDPVDLQHMISRFRHEARAVGRLTHPRIVQIYDYGENDELAYIVMELVNGKSLQEHLSKGASFSLHEIVEIIRPLLDGLGYVHAEGVVHRDLKPSNIMINNDGRIKLCDFGIAHTESSELTQIGDVLGSLHYMSPEQFLGLQIDSRTDIYSVGVVAYELLTGQKPFVGNSAAVMQQVINQRPADPSSIKPGLSPQIDEVLHRALAKKSADRYQTARQFSDAFIQAISASSSQSAKPIITQPPAGLLNAARMITPRAPQPAAAPATSAVDFDLGLDMNAAPQPEEIAAEITGGHLAVEKSAKRSTILVVDDEERILTALKSLFRMQYDVLATTDGNQALEYLRQQKVNVVISDQRMPIMLGVDLLRQAREISPATVRILLTGYSDLASIVGSINDGEVYRFISKPWSNQELQQTVAEAVTIATELAEAPANTTSLPQHIEAGILVIDQDEEIHRITKGVIDGLCPVYYAPNLDAALMLMKEHEIAVVLADVGTGNEEVAAMIKLLKQENPQILTIVLTAASDSDLVIELINQAQIFRFLNKPVKVKFLKSHLYAALAQYLTYQKSPQLLHQHKVQEAALVRNSSLGKKILSGLLTLPARWFKAG